jgi:FAD:protein FMN transferase
VRLLIVFFISLFCLAFSLKHPVRKFLITGHGQGTTYQVQYYSTDSVIKKDQIDSILEKIDSSLSLYKSYSLINRFNSSDKGIVVDGHFEKVLLKSLSTYKETNGIFDVTVEPLVRAWGFGSSAVNTVPDSALIQSLRQCIGSGNLQVSGSKIVKKKPCIKIDLNGIAQGYTVDLIANLLDMAGLKHYMVELGGEIRVRGRKQPGNEKMKIGIEAPGNDEFQRAIMQKIIAIDHGAITTSGSYRRYYESEGKQISHLIDPRTGYPVQNELISITVYAKDAMTADAIDNALMLMGLEKAMLFVEKRRELAAHFIYRAENGAIRDTMSKRFTKLVQ